MNASRAGLLAAAVTSLVARDAAASNESAAEALFRDGQRLLAAGQVHEACSKLAESLRLDRAVGTLINLAVCHEREGKIATAWGLYSDAEVQAHRAGHRDRERYAHERARALEKRISRIELFLPVPDPAAEVRIDGETLRAAIAGTAIPVDPGTHELIVSAAGKQPWRKTLQIGEEAATHRIEVPPLEDVPPVAAPSVAETPAAPAQVPSDATRRRRHTGYVVGGAGMVTIVAGAVFGARALSLAADARTQAANGQPQAVVDESYDGARSNQLVGILLGGVGALAVGAGAYLVLVPSPRSTHSLSLWPHVAGNGGGVLLTYE